MKNYFAIEYDSTKYKSKKNIMFYDKCALIYVFKNSDARNSWACLTKGVETTMRREHISKGKLLGGIEEKSGISHLFLRMNDPGTAYMQIDYRGGKRELITYDA